jgi:hypothetical protein
MWSRGKYFLESPGHTGGERYGEWMPVMSIRNIGDIVPEK